MSDALIRLTTSVNRVVTDVASSLRAHPNAQDDGGQLNGLADQLDTVSAEIEATLPADNTGTGSGGGSGSGSDVGSGAGGTASAAGTGDQAAGTGDGAGNQPGV